MELTRLEQRVMSVLRDSDVITIDNLYKLNKFLKFAEKSTIKEIAFRLVKKGNLVRLKRGKYMVVKALENRDALKMANYIFDGYIALTSALFIYGYNQTKSFIIWGVTSSRKKIRKIGEYTYIALPMGKLVFGSVYHNGYKVSTKAKTLFDCVYNIHYIEDIGPLLDLIRDMNEEDFSELLKYLHIIQTSSIIQRIGFILGKANAPKKTLSKIKKLSGKSVIRLDKNNRRYLRYNREWKVFDNINIDRFLR